MDNVNNLNGVPNFGHGFDDVSEEFIHTDAETPALDEENTHDETVPTTVKYGKTKRKN